MEESAQVNTCNTVTPSLPVEGDEESPVCMKRTREDEYTYRWEECPVCSCLFDEASRVPICMPCNHTICRMCATTLFPTADGGRCPICREEVLTSAAALRPNYQLRGLLLEWKSRSYSQFGTPVVTPGTDETPVVARPPTTSTPSLECAPSVSMEIEFEPPGGSSCYPAHTPMEYSHTRPKRDGTLEHHDRGELFCTAHKLPAICFCKECFYLVCVDCMMTCIHSHGKQLIRVNDGSFLKCVAEEEKDLLHGATHTLEYLHNVVNELLDIETVLETSAINFGKVSKLSSMSDYLDHIDMVVSVHLRSKELLSCEAFRRYGHHGGDLESSNSVSEDAIPDRSVSVAESNPSNEISGRPQAELSSGSRRNRTTLGKISGVSCSRSTKRGCYTSRAGKPYVQERFTASDLKQIPPCTDESGAEKAFPSSWCREALRLSIAKRTVSVHERLCALCQRRKVPEVALIELSKVILYTVCPDAISSITVLSNEIISPPSLHVQIQWMLTGVFDFIAQITLVEQCWWAELYYSCESIESLEWWILVLQLFTRVLKRITRKDDRDVLIAKYETPKMVKAIIEVGQKLKTSNAASMWFAIYRVLMNHSPTYIKNVPDVILYINSICSKLLTPEMTSASETAMNILNKLLTPKSELKRPHIDAALQIIMNKLTDSCASQKFQCLSLLTRFAKTYPDLFLTPDMRGLFLTCTPRNVTIKDTKYMACALYELTLEHAHLVQLFPCALDLLEMLSGFVLKSSTDGERLPTTDYVEWFARVVANMARYELVRQGDVHCVSVLRDILIRLCHYSGTMEDVQAISHALNVFLQNGGDHINELATIEIRDAFVRHLLPRRGNRKNCVWNGFADDAVRALFLLSLVCSPNEPVPVESHHLLAIMNCIQEESSITRVVSIVRRWLTFNRAYVTRKEIGQICNGLRLFIDKWTQSEGEKNSSFTTMATEVLEMARKCVDMDTVPVPLMS